LQARQGAGNTKGGSISVPFTSCLTGLDWSVLQMKTKILSSHTADSQPVKQEVNGTVILPPLVFLARSIPVKWSTIKFSTEVSFDNLNLNLMLIPSRCSTLGQAPGLAHKH
jgi:hypothetical protein